LRVTPCSCNLATVMHSFSSSADCLTLSPATGKPCPNSKCKCPDCTCGEGCTCNKSTEVFSYTLYSARLDSYGPWVLHLQGDMRSVPRLQKGSFDEPKWCQNRGGCGCLCRCNAPLLTARHRRQGPTSGSDLGVAVAFMGFICVAATVLRRALG